MFLLLLFLFFFYPVPVCRIIPLTVEFSIIIVVEKVQLYTVRENGIVEKCVEEMAYDGCVPSTFYYCSLHSTVHVMMESKMRRFRCTCA